MRFRWTDDPPVAVTVPDTATLLSDIETRLAGQEGFSIATLNLDHAVKLRREPEFHHAYAAHSHVTADGNPIVWLCRLAGQQDVTLVPGSELIAPLCAVAERTGAPIALFGATEASLQAAAESLGEIYPELKITLCLSPPMGFDPDSTAADQAIAQIRDSGARLVFVAFGAPKQERFAARAQNALPHVGFVSIGAGLDFISGNQTRAPLWVRKLAAEWIWRMLGDPKRLARRYGACILAMPGLTLSALRARRSQPDP